MAPQYIPVSHPYSSAPSNNLVAHHQVEQLQPQHNPFSFATYTGGSSNGIVPVFGNNYIRPRPQPASLLQHNAYSPRNVPQGYGEDHYNHHHSQSPPIKYEAPLNIASSSPQVSSQNKEIASTVAANCNGEEFGTEVDTLMKAIQAKEQSAKPQSALEQTRSVVSASRPQHGRTVSPSGLYTTGDERNYKLTHEDSQGSAKHDKGTKKRYQCKIGKCTKSFYQKTHLEIHERAHTGVKPYECTHPGCDRTFSQHGNLRTHLRRHTGERPFSCDECGRTFAQKGNVRAHKVVHSNSKPFICHLDDCGKEFTQRGNLKSHQNKFHIATIRALTTKFASYQHGDHVSQADRALWEYFADLYKNSNKGIKGRGKDRRIQSARGNLNSSMRSLNVTPGGSGHYNALGHRTMMGRDLNQYEMYEIDDSGSHSGSSHSSQGSGGSCYEDAPSDGYEEVGKTELAFGDRIY